MEPYVIGKVDLVLKRGRDLDIIYTIKANGKILIIDVLVDGKEMKLYQTQFDTVGDLIHMYYDLYN